MNSVSSNAAYVNRIASYIFNISNDQNPVAASYVNLAGILKNQLGYSEEQERSVFAVIALEGRITYEGSMRLAIDIAAGNLVCLRSFRK
jgi:hypothetical protein